MSDTGKSKFKQPFLAILILLLFLLVSLQAWYMFEMKKQMDVLHGQQSSVQLPAKNTIANEKSMPEKNYAEPNDTKERPKQQQSSLQENQHTPPAQSQDISLSTDNTQPLINDEHSDTTFGGQAWNPYKKTERTQHDRDRMFNRSLNNFDNRPGVNNSGVNKPNFNRPDFQYHFSQSFSTPKMDVKENANQYVVFVNLPGANENEISVTLNGQRLTVKGKQDYKKQNRNATGNIVFKESRSGSFQRSITLANPVNKNQMKTRLNNGVLTIIIPKIKNRQWR